ncbi:MAG TPA: acyl-CoA dehydratase activase [Syntrophorhabdales bacterium]|nr:acyl-CoA dehydratase activase [Syntrophorhabdales bacterium]
MFRIGLDIGSVSVNVVLVDDKGLVVEDRYIRHKGKPIKAAKEVLEELTAKHGARIEYVATTGVGAKKFAELVGAAFTNEIIALTKAFQTFYPHVGSVIDLGGEDSKYIIFERDKQRGTLKIKDFSMNTLCAAGTGSFLDQQASRLGFSIEEFGEVALKSKNTPRIAGRCTVFAKSDMIHLQQIATPDYELVAGLCYALARNFKSNIAKGKEVAKPLAFIGGVAANPGMRKAIQEVFSVEESQFIVPERFTSMGALGAVYAVLDEPRIRREYQGVANVDKYLAQEEQADAYEPLVLSEKNREIRYDVKKPKEKVKVYFGVDVGSISTNLVAIDEQKNVLAKRYLMTGGRPLEAVKRGLAEIGEEIGEYVEIVGVGTTGSGRYLTADFIGADIVRNEITAQAEAAIEIDPEVDTIFEIGGQDSKYISIDNGVIVDFEMNKACAAGTGSFLEEQAERLGLSIKDEFADLALKSDTPIKMGERCTVFIESDVIHHQQAGADVEDIAGGLCFSIVLNYLNKVVGDRRVGNRIFFQGGTAFNKGVVAAFERVVGKPITVPSHHDVTGAIGVAILAMKERTWEKSTFKGFDLSKRQYSIDTFECKGCENLCEIRKVTCEGETPLYYGSRCEKYDVVRKVQKKAITDLFKFREDQLYKEYAPIAQGKGETIGIPRILNMHELLPFWKAFLGELGFSVLLSDATNKKVIKEGVENIIVESCFPIKLAHGHILNLVAKGAKRIFLPSIIDLKKPSEGVETNFACPYAQSLPYTVKASIDFEAMGVKLESPIVRFGQGPEIALKNLVAFGKSLGRSKKEVERAFHIANSVQDLFYGECLHVGADFLSRIKGDEKVMVVIGRPYNSVDPGANLNVHKKLLDLGVPAVPLDMLPLSSVPEDEDLREMYWGYGQKILRAAKIIRSHPNLFAIYITNFGCGPDSFITHFFKKIMEGKPFLQLEIDEHSGDAGVITRLEAYFDSIKNARQDAAAKEKAVPVFYVGKKTRKIYVPYMSDHSFPFVSAFRAAGAEAEVMEESDDETVQLGRKYTIGKECYPCILTTGDMLKTVQKEGFEPTASAFFMPSGKGPCRFGQYHRLHRMVLDERGYANVPIYAPNQDEKLYQELNIVGGKFSRLGWRAIVSTDLLLKMLHGIRPYEEVAGQTEQVYKEMLSAISKAIESGNNGLFEVLEHSVKRFLSVPTKKTAKPLVGIVGEIYIRSNRFSNDDLVKRVEEFGGEAWLAPITEWINYVNYMGRKRSTQKRSLSNLLSMVLTDHIQRKDEHRMEEIFSEYLRYGREPQVRQVINDASPYIDESFEGEAILSVGKSIDFIRKGASGIINAMPFTCMPGTISSAVMKLIQNKYGVPVLNVAYDGQGLTNISTRLEAFMHQVKEHSKRPPNSK